MDTRKTIKMLTSGFWGVQMSQTPDNPSSWQAAQSVYFQRPNGFSGSAKIVTSEREGYFTPGTFRANPCIMREMRASATAGYAVSNKWHVGWYYRLIDHFWYQACQRNTSFEMSELDEWSTNEASLAVVKTRAKLREAEWNAFVALGELRETLELLRNPLKCLRDSLLQFLKKQGKFRKTLLVGDAASGSWMTYRYAIVPLISDVIAAVKLLQKKLEQIQGMQRVSGGQRVDMPLSGTVSDSSWGFTWVMAYERQMYRLSIHHVYFERMLMSTNELLARLMGFDQSQLAQNVWELVSRSFVIDWVFAVGSWLAAITPDPKITYLGNCTSQKIVKRITCDVVSIRHEIGLRRSEPVVLPRYTWDSSTLHRQVGTSTVVMPPFNPNYFNIKRLLDSLSMLWHPATANVRRLK